MRIEDFQEGNIACLNLVDERELYEVISSELFWSNLRIKGFKIFEINNEAEASEVWILFTDGEKMYIESLDTQINQLDHLESFEICNNENLNLRVNKYFLEKLSEF
ncbi:hypothetical protein [uncultured Clostridium sp.]|uniref:hypothetical protein n=1 Tax=uncultured Clostridium sp. TaxID=59620 RepID=UPI002629023E|nr:hypothetical protein [uncultured Clostridium sp.]